MYFCYSFTHKQWLKNTELTVTLLALNPPPAPSYCLGSGPENGGGIRCEEEEEQEEEGEGWIFICSGGRVEVEDKMPVHGSVKMEERS